jgi:hypothetical protein
MNVKLEMLGIQPTIIFSGKEISYAPVTWDNIVDLGWIFVYLLIYSNNVNLFEEDGQ